MNQNETPHWLKETREFAIEFNRLSGCIVLGVPMCLLEGAGFHVHILSCALYLLSQFGGVRFSKVYIRSGRKIDNFFKTRYYEVRKLNVKTL